MAAKLIPLTTKPEKLRQDQADRLREALQEIEVQMELPIHLMRSIYTHVEKSTSSQNKWTFLMLSPQQNRIVVKYLLENSKRPMVAVDLWSLCFEHLRTDTGEILLSREEIAKKIGQESRTISSLMTELENCGAIIKRYEKVAGMKGRGVVRYFMNPNVATHLGGGERDKAQSEAPLLTLMQGGKDAR